MCSGAEGLGAYCEYNAGQSGYEVGEGMNPQIGPHMPLDELAEYIHQHLPGDRK